MASKVYKKDIAEKLSDEFNLTRDLAIEETDFIFNLLTDYLQKGQDITITNFGTFTLKERKINNDDKIKYVNFKSAKKVKDKIND